MSKKPSIVYTKTDEAPALATYSFLPIIQAYLKSAEIDVSLSDISLAGRILSQFNERLTPEQRVEDALQRWVHYQRALANIMLPNISASFQPPSDRSCRQTCTPRLS